MILEPIMRHAMLLHNCRRASPWASRLARWHRRVPAPPAGAAPDGGRCLRRTS